jgi:hypothetical protein
MKDNYLKLKEIETSHTLGGGGGTSGKVVSKEREVRECGFLFRCG